MGTRWHGGFFAAGSASWPSGGQNLSNTHSNDVDKKIDTSNVGRLAVKWKTSLQGDVSAVPAVAAGLVLVAAVGWAWHHLGHRRAQRRSLRQRGQQRREFWGWE